MDWNFQSVKYLHELVQQYGGRKSGGWEAEFQERIRKEWACLQRGGSFCGFGFECPSVFKAGLPDSESSNLVKVSTVLKVTSRNSGHCSWAHRHSYVPPNILRTPPGRHKDHPCGHSMMERSTPQFTTPVGKGRAIWVSTASQVRFYVECWRGLRKILDGVRRILDGMCRILEGYVKI